MCSVLIKTLVDKQTMKRIHVTTETTSSMNSRYHISEDIIGGEILPRLPVESLLRFRCVSKSWNSLISSSGFVKSHLKKSTDDKSFSHHGIIVYYHKHYNVVNSNFRNTKFATLFMRCSLRSWLDNPSTFDVDDFKSMNNDFKRRPPIQEPSTFVGTCNGLCCFQMSRRVHFSIEQFLLWNPATNWSYLLPDLVVSESGEITTNVAGFGFDEANDDYKVLVVSQVNVNFNIYEENPPWLSLYSSRTNSWKEVEGFEDWAEDWNFHDQLLVFLNGKIHFCIVGETMDSISFFDLEREEHGLLELPEPLNKSSRLQSVGLLDGCLSCVLYCESTLEFHLWIMRQYGLKESWQLVLSTCDDLEYNDELVCRAEGGEVMIACHNGFLIYDPESASRRYLTWDDTTSFSSHIYVESLVSPVPELLRDTP